MTTLLEVVEENGRTVTAREAGDCGCGCYEEEVYDCGCGCGIGMTREASAGSPESPAPKGGQDRP